MSRWPLSLFTDGAEAIDRRVGWDGVGHGDPITENAADRVHSVAA